MSVGVRGRFRCYLRLHLRRLRPGGAFGFLAGGIRGRLGPDPVRR